MSQIVAAVSWGDGADRGIGIGKADVEAVLGPWPADLRKVGEMSTAVFGCAIVATDRWRREDHTPLVDPLGGVALCADCRLDNRTALRKELGANETAPDSQLLRLAYARWGAEMGEHLRGDFACVIWDERSRRLLAIRDPLGIKPLFYSSLGANGIVLASDVESIVKLARSPRQPDDHRVVEHLLWEYHSTDRTFWRSIRRLPGGHSLLASVGERSVARYWNPSRSLLETPDREEVHSRFRELFTASVQNRIESDRPVLAHLSGGVDSSLIVCTADRICRDRLVDRPRVHAVSERYPGMSCDEGPFIAAVAESVQFPLFEWNAFPATFDDLDAPTLAGPSMRAQRTSGSAGDLAFARELGAQVVLSGSGGDQLGSTAGLASDLREGHLASQLWDTLSNSDRSIRQRAARARQELGKLVPVRLRRARAAWIYRRNLPAWLDPSWASVATSFAERAYDEEATFPTQVQRAHWADLTSGRTQGGADLEQRCASVAGVEARYPFLDRDLVEFVLTIPPLYWPNPDGSNVRLQREFMADALPVRIRSRRSKAGFAVAMKRRVRAATSRLKSLIDGGHWASERWVNRKYAKTLLDRFAAREDASAQDAHALWRIGTLEAWLRCVFGYAP